MVNRDEMVMAGCERCGTVHAGQLVIDGGLKLIGRNGCVCGSTEFVVVEDG
ncbi:hypothetical protein [Natronobiforma cellulositropha]|uniref:hypothetical protein n=1 Tax=Natronobiforma cellulositropha TaxID=1679076 RepID=UPI0021D5ED39|nr:hypothetical protein [Natronobiforma cellulositropha]